MVTKLKGLLVLLCAILVMPFLAGCTEQVPPGNVGILFDGSRGICETINPRVVWVGPYQQLIVYPTRITNATYVKNATEGDKKVDDSIKASTSEGAILPIDVTVAWHVQPDEAIKAFNTFGTSEPKEMEENYLRWLTSYSVNVVSGKHSIFDLISKDRANLGSEVSSQLQPLLAPLGITVDNVYIGELYPSAEIKAKIDESLAARSELEQKKTELTKAGIEAKTTLTNARKKATENQLLASQGEKAAELKRLEVRRILASKWNGVPPLVGSGGIPFADMTGSH